MSNIRILHFVSSLSKSGGVMNVIMNYYRHIDTEKIQFDFLFFQNLDDTDDTYEEEIKKKGGKVYLISKPSLNNKFKEELSNILSKETYAALHNHEVYLTFLLAPIAKQNGISNIIAHSHTTMYSDKLISSFRNRFLCLGLKKNATYYFSCSKAAGEFLYGKKSVDSGNVEVINNAVDCERFRFNEVVRKNIREELGLEKNIVFGHVGRFSEQKNHMFLIEIFAALKKKEKRAKLLVVGDGPLFNQVRRKIHQLNISSEVVFLGKRDDVPDLLQAMDIFLLPSLFEGLPVVGVEAQVSGLPIVMSSNITKEIGLLNYEYISLDEDANNWADKILEMPINLERQNSCDILMENGFDISIEAKNLEVLYMGMK